jgi:hypothetical protein
VREIGGRADETHRNEVLLSQTEDDDEVSETRQLKEVENRCKHPVQGGQFAEYLARCCGQQKMC